MTKDELLLQIWEYTQHLIKETTAMTGDHTVDAIRFRGHNPNSPNKVAAGKISLWVNLWAGTRSKQLNDTATDILLERHGEILLTVWSQVIGIFGNGTNYVSISPPGSSEDSPGVYCKPIKDEEYSEEHYFQIPAAMLEKQ